jgi:hypothetical protein
MVPTELHDRIKYTVMQGHLGRLIMWYTRTLTSGDCSGKCPPETGCGCCAESGLCVPLLLTKASGRQVLPGADTPFLECPVPVQCLSVGSALFYVWLVLLWCFWLLSGL